MCVCVCAHSTLYIIIYSGVDPAELYLEEVIYFLAKGRGYVDKKKINFVQHFLRDVNDDDLLII